MPTLIVLGASARAAAHSAIRAGLDAYAIDCFADRDLAAVCPAIKMERYPRAFPSALAAAPAAAWLYTGGLENHPRLVDELARLRPLAGNGGNTLKLVRDPRRLAAAAAETGCAVPIPATGAKTLLKPLRSSGGLGIRLATPAEALRPPRGYYLQPYVEGEAASAVFVAAAGRAILLGATRQLLGRDYNLAHEFLYVGSLGPLALTAAEQAALTELADRLAAECALVGLFNIDFLRTGGAIYPVEVNPRYSASIEVLERATDLATISLHLAACDGEKFRWPPRAPRQCCGKAVVYACAAGVVPPELTPLIAEWNKPASEPLLADLPRVGETIRVGQPVLTVFAEATSLAEVERLLRQRVELVHRTLQL